MTISTNYHGINKDELSRIVSTSSPDLSNVPESERVYLGKTLSTHEFYKGRMMTDGNETAESVFNSKYLGPAETGPLNTWYRLSTAMSSVEKTPEQQEERFYEFMDALDDFKLVPGGRIMHGGGREDIKTTLNNCYVVAIPGDSINSIYQAIQDEATTFKKGGGCGTNLSILRPEDAGIKGTGGVSCGPTGFMELYSTNTNTIAQHGRRGALMLNISSWHPDVEKFATIKNDIEGPKAQLEALVEKYPWEKDVLKGLREDLESRRGIRYANISVLLGHDFISAVENDTDFDLRFPDVDAYGSVPEMKEFYNRVWDGDISRWEESFKGAQAKGEIPEDMLALKTSKTIKAKSLWDTIIHNAHTSAEPGILFWDTMRDFHNLEYCSPLS
ncbi:hypothetical protein HN747_04570, partial [archaeon]|nr:hypothetical protein [archaeon]